MERYFKFIKYNGDTTALFKSNDEEMIVDQKQRVKFAPVSMVEISEDEYKQLEREMDN